MCARVYVAACVEGCCVITAPSFLSILSMRMFWVRIAYVVGVRAGYVARAKG